MTALTRRRFVAGSCCSCAALALAGCVASGEGGAPIDPGYRPSNATDEGGLWQVMDKAEEETKRSRHLIRDPELHRYVHDVACRLAGDHCPDIRLYLVRTPFFNASMAPNGMMSVWSGLLLRTNNEAQLAAILGHEIGHYLQRHSLQKWRDVRAKTNASAFLGLGLAVAGAPPGSAEMAQFMTVASVFAFSREQEREADDVGVTLMAAAGYAPIEASRVWQQLIEEQAADPSDGTPSALFATHPAPAERLATLRSKAGTLGAPGQVDGAERYRAQLRETRKMLFADELRLRQFPRTLVLLDRLSAELPSDGDVPFFYGQLYRLRDQEGDLSRALAAYENSIATGDPPVEAWRGLGLVLRQTGDHRRAAEAFERYLALDGEAPDRALIRSYIDGAA